VCFLNISSKQKETPMGLLIGEAESHLTNTNPALQAKRGKTYPGMAHFATTGPENTSCRECVFWGAGARHDYYALGGKPGGALKPHPCAKYRTMMRGEQGPGVPHDAPSCKYFEASTEPPGLRAKT
jgi:hypothetical protein